MEHSKLPFASHFSKLREYPNWHSKINFNRYTSHRYCYSEYTSD